MIKLVILDLGKVLIDFDFAIAIRRLQRRFTVNVVKLAALFRTSSLADDFDRGKLSERQFFETIQKEMNFPISMGDFTLYWNKIFTEKKEMVDLAHKLKKKYPITILSNTNPWHVAHLRKNHRWVFEFNDFVASCEVKLMKPDPEIYRTALKRARARPEETFYIDDAAENVEAAQKLGMDAVRFRDYPSILKEIKMRNLTV